MAAAMIWSEYCGYFSAVAAALVVTWSAVLLPWGLAFAAGAMLALFVLGLPAQGFAGGLDPASVPEIKRSKLQLYLTPQGRALVEGLDALRTEIATELLCEVEDEALRATLDTLATIRSRIREGRRERQAGPAVPTAATAGAA